MTTPHQDPRLDAIISFAEERYGLIFRTFIDVHEAMFTDAFTLDSVPSTTYIAKFWQFQQQRYVQGTLLLLHGSFSIPAANFCSGWLVFEDADLPEIRFLRHANVPIVFNGCYSRVDLIRGIEE